MKLLHQTTIALTTTVTIGVVAPSSPYTRVKSSLPAFLLPPATNTQTSHYSNTPLPLLLFPKLCGSFRTVRNVWQSKSKGATKPSAKDIKNQYKNAIIKVTTRYATRADSISPCTNEISLRSKIFNGVAVAPLLITAPFYAVGFGIFGCKRMWAISEWIYSSSKPTEGYLHEHFRQTQKVLESGMARATTKSHMYRIHPFSAGVSLISTAVLAFISPSKIEAIVPHRRLLIANMCICFTSALSAKFLEDGMFGHRNTARRWVSVQGILSVFFAALSLSPGSLGCLMVHLNWSLMFSAGVLERFYVLCVMSQFDVPDRNTYREYYSPQFKMATIASIPLGLVTYFNTGAN